MNGEKQAKVPALIKPIRIPSFQFTEMAPLFDNLPAAKKDRNIRTMEEYNQGFGSILYRTTLPEMKTPSLLTVNDAHDYAQVSWMANTSANWTAATVKSNWNSPPAPKVHASTFW